MRRSSKERALNEPLNRLLHTDREEALNLSVPQQVEVSQELGQTGERVKISLRKKHR